MKYIYQNTDWHSFKWCGEKTNNLLLELQKTQGYLFGKMDVLGFDVKNNASLNIITENIIKSSEIESETLNKEQVHLSVARKLGLDFNSNISVSRNIEGIVDMMFDATQNYNKPLTHERLFG